MLRCKTQPKILLLIVAVCFLGNHIQAQTTHLLPPNQPEQDACHALLLCGSNFFVGQGKLLQYNFVIYNRWGKEVFATNNFYKGWDGRVNSYLQTADTYVWFCQYQLAGEQLQTQKGTVTLIR